MLITIQYYRRNRKTNRGSEENERKIIVNRNYLQENDWSMKYMTILHGVVTKCLPVLYLVTHLETIDD